MIEQADDHRVRGKKFKDDSRRPIVTALFHPVNTPIIYSYGTETDVPQKINSMGTSIKNE